MSRPLEAALRTKWKKHMQAHGCWPQPLGASQFGSGTPDFLCGYPARGDFAADAFGDPDLSEPQLVFLEGKRTLPGRTVYRPKQCTIAQQLFLSNVLAFGGDARVLLLDETGWMDLPWLYYSKRVLTRAEFNAQRIDWAGHRPLGDE